MREELFWECYVERCRLCKQICASKASPTKQTTSDSTYSTSTYNNNVDIVGLLSRPGKRGLEAACRSAYEMATSVCQNTQDTTLWLQMPHTVTNIGANIKAYEIIQVIRKKHPDSDNTARRAAIALRDALTLLIVNNYESFDEALLHIANTTNLPMGATRQTPPVTSSPFQSHHDRPGATNKRHRGQNSQYLLGTALTRGNRGYPHCLPGLHQADNVQHEMQAF